MAGLKGKPVSRTPRANQASKPESAPVFLRIVSGAEPATYCCAFMVPHYAYQAPFGGAYYFRPYVAQHIGRQADFVGTWSGDRSNPYDNRFLQAIYGPAGE